MSPAKWFTDRQKKLAPPVTLDRCMCSQCDGLCEDVPEWGVRCPECADFGPNGRHRGVFDWRLFCKTNHSEDAHGDPRGGCKTREEHKARIAQETSAIKEMTRTFDHVLDVAKSRREKGQVTLWE